MAKPTTSGDTPVAGSRQPSQTRKSDVTKIDVEASLAEFASFHEGYLRHYVALADTKAVVLFGLVTTFVTFLFSKSGFQLLVFEPSCHWRSVLAWASAVLLIVGAGLGTWVIAPRLKHTGEGLVFFGAVRAHAHGEAYAQAVRAARGERLNDARLRHCYDVSNICWNKYQNLRLAIWVSALGLVLALPLLGSI